MSVLIFLYQTGDLIAPLSGKNRVSTVVILTPKCVLSVLYYGEESFYVCFCGRLWGEIITRVSGELRAGRGWRDPTAAFSLSLSPESPCTPQFCSLSTRLWIMRA